MKNLIILVGTLVIATSTLSAQAFYWTEVFQRRKIHHA